MATILDIQEGAEFDHSADGTRLIRAAHVGDIPASAASDPGVLLRAAFDSGIPALMEPHPNAPNLRVRRHIVRRGATTNDAHVLIIYEGPPQQEDGIVGATWVIEDRNSLAQEVEELDPAGNPVQVTFTYVTTGPPISETNPTPSPVVASSKFTAGVPVLRPRRTISAAGMVRGRPSINWVEAQGRVNSNDFAGRPPGFWLCTEVAARLSGKGRWGSSNEEQNNDQVYNVEVSFLSKELRDWSSYVTYRTPQGHIPALMQTPDEAAARRAVMDAPYSETPNLTANGFGKWGMYGTADFAAIFALPL